MMGAQEHVNKLTIEIQILLYWKYKYLNFAKGWKVVERCLTSDSGQETWWKRSNLRYSWNSKEAKKHNDNNEVNANRYLAAMLNSFVIQKEEDIYKSSFDAIGNIRWITKKRRNTMAKNQVKNKDISCCRDNYGIQNKKRNTHRQGKKRYFAAIYKLKKGHLLFCNLRYSWNSRG